MEARSTSLQQLVGELDELFCISDWHRDPALKRGLPMVCHDIAYDYTETFPADFFQRPNDPMLQSGDTVTEVYDGHRA